MLNVRTNVATLVLHDCVGEAFGGVSADRILSDLARVEKDGCARLDLDVYSAGGCARSSLEIFDALRNLDAHIVAHVTGVAASGASVIASAANEIVMHRDAFFMIHNASVDGGSGDARDRAAEELAELDEAMTEIYAQRSGLDEAVVRELMASESWFCSTDSLDLQLIDAIA